MSALISISEQSSDRASNDETWLTEMAWAVPLYSKKKVNWAGEQLVTPAPADISAEEYDAWLIDYMDALDIINNWRSSHNFPLNTFHVGLRRRARGIDAGSITAQRIKRLSSIEHKLHRFETMTLSQMQDIGGCRAILPSVSNVKALARSYERSEIKHSLQQKDDYLENPRESGYRGVHLIYRYYSDRKQDYNSLKIEIQLRSQFQHIWATAVETVGTFLQQALKSSLGEKEWLRFFALMGTAIAVRERCPLVPNTPTTYTELVKELREYARALDISNKLSAFGAAIQVFENQKIRDDHYFLLEVNHHSKLVTITGFKRAQSSIATAKYLEAEKKVKQLPSADAVLVSVDSMAALRRAYPNYFFDTGVFVALVDQTLKSTRRPKTKPTNRKELPLG